MPEWYVEGDTQARVRERKGARLRALCVVSRWWESGKSVFHFERLKVQTSIYSASQIILSSRTQERWNVNRLFFSPNREPVHKLWNVPLRSFNLDSILCLLRQNSFNTIDTVSDRFFFFFRVQPKLSSPGMTWMRWVICVSFLLLYKLRDWNLFILIYGHNYHLTHHPCKFPAIIVFINFSLFLYW